MRSTHSVDAVNDCAHILSFLSTAFTSPERQQITLSYEANSGLALILEQISQRLFASASAIENKEVQP